MRFTFNLRGSFGSGSIIGIGSPITRLVSFGQERAQWRSTKAIAIPGA